VRTPEDIINRKEANQRYYKLEENKEQKRHYMKTYSRLPHNKEKAHEYYTVNKMHWVEKKKKKWGTIRQETEDGKILHEEWAIKNGYRDNDVLHATNVERIIKDAKK